MSAVPESSPPTVDLTPFVPRVVVDWLRADAESLTRRLEGTLAFVDISGFTALNERLAQKGKLGAEEVTEVMNRTFERLLDEAYALGGGLLKFGGDALLLFFSGEGHATRACDAAWGMRAALEALGEPQTSVGPVTLRMHVGVHSDGFDFFLVGESHRELLLTGPGVTTTVQMEAGAEAGEILVSEATAATLPPEVLGEAKAGGRLLESPPRARGTVEPLPSLEGLDLAACVPAAVRSYILDGRAEAEHRQAAVAFVHFGGVDDLLASGGADEVAAALQELVAGAQRVADEHRVTFLETDIDTDGGKIILVAGAPRTEGGDEERILRTARGIADLPTRLPLRVGTSRGRVFAGEVGAQFRRTYTILGKTAALAARLMGKAKPGQVLTTLDVLERSRSAFATAELEPLTLKGIAEPIRAYDVLSVGGEVESAAERLPFVGRERELTILSAALGPVRMGFGNIVELLGEPGMGKSRLVEELQAQAPDLATVTATCLEYEASTPYFAFRGLLRSLLELPQNGAAATALHERIEDLDPDLLPWLPLVALPLDLAVEPTLEVEDLQPAFRRARLHGVVEAVLTKLLPQPTLFVLEDVHWMDEASAELLRHLGGQVTTKPWLLCATRRPADGGFSAADGVPPLPAMTIQLQPLDGDAAQQLVGAAATEGLLQHEVAAITERAGGNPLFLQELVASSGAPDEEALPESVEAVVATRIDRLGAGDRALLRYAAVLGATFSAELVTSVLADDPEASADSEAWDRLAEFVERDPYTPGAFRFRHALFRDAAYEGLSYRRRGELHAKVGGAYERLEREGRGEFAELLSLHYFHAGDAERTYRYSLLAGERAQEKFANVEAAAFFRRAIGVASELELDPAEVAKAWEALGDVSELAGLYADAEEAYAKARELDGHPRLLLKEGVISERFGRYAEALQWYDRGLRSLDDLEADEQATMRAELALAYAGVRVRQGEFVDGAAWCKRVVEDAANADNLPALAHAYYLMHLAYISNRSPERAALRGLAVPIYEELGDLLGQANALNNLGVDAYYEGRWQEALELYDRSKALRERIGDVVGAAQITNNIGEVKSDQGYLTTAAELFEEARQVFETAGHRMLGTLALSNLGRTAAREGRLDDAKRMLDDAVAIFDQIKAGGFLIEARTRLAERAVFAGEPAEALIQADAALAAIEQSGGGSLQHALVHRIRGYALAQQGALEEAQEAFATSAELAREADESYELALTLQAQALLAELMGNDAPLQAAESRTLLARLGVV
ncbi:MAG TPA: AAA family ATPase, partial [Gaiellaceae bacterium]|nr:AAA family ATPase [Gaiellaceae bacterium]